MMMAASQFCASHHLDFGDRGQLLLLSVHQHLFRPADEVQSAPRACLITGQHLLGFRLLPFLSRVFDLLRLVLDAGVPARLRVNDWRAECGCLLLLQGRAMHQWKQHVAPHRHDAPPRIFPSLLIALTVQNVFLSTADLLDFVSGFHLISLNRLKLVPNYPLNRGLPHDLVELRISPMARLGTQLLARQGTQPLGAQPLGRLGLAMLFERSLQRRAANDIMIAKLLQSIAFRLEMKTSIFRWYFLLRFSFGLIPPRLFAAGVPFLLLQMEGQNWGGHLMRVFLKLNQFSFGLMPKYQPSYPLF